MSDGSKGGEGCERISRGGERAVEVRHRQMAPDEEAKCEIIKGGEMSKEEKSEGGEGEPAAGGG